MGTEGIWIPLLIGAGTAVAAYGQYEAGKAAEEQGRAEQELANYNAEIKDREAKAELAKSIEEANQFREQGKGLMASQRVGYARAGVLGTEGSPAQLMEETKFNLEEDRMKIIRDGYLGQSFAMSQAEGMRFQGRSAAMRGKNARTGSMYAMGGTILTGIGSAAYAGSTLGGGGAGSGMSSKAGYGKGFNYGAGSGF